MARNLRGQLAYALNESTAFGTSKRLDRLQGNSTLNKIYSFQEMKNVVDTSRQFAKFMKNEFPEIKKIADVTSKHYNEFLRNKTSTCNSRTLSRYQSDLRKISACSARTFKSVDDISRDIKLPSRLEETAKIKDVVMEQADFDLLKASYGHANQQYMRDALSVSEAVGCRVEGLSKIKASDIALRGSEAHVTIRGEKGGRVRTVVVTEQRLVQPLADIVATKGANQLICPIKPDSINANLRRHLKSLGLSHKYPQTVHAIRKMVACREYDKVLKDEGKHSAIAKTNELLGHSAARDSDLLRHYVPYV